MFTQERGTRSEKASVANTLFAKRNNKGQQAVTKRLRVHARRDAACHMTQSRSQPVVTRPAPGRPLHCHSPLSLTPSRGSEVGGHVRTWQQAYDATGPWQMQGLAPDRLGLD